MRRFTLAERADASWFWGRVEKRGPSECWLWVGLLHKRNGYGWAYDPERRRPDSTHRISWRLAHGPIASGKCVLHACDNRPCVNPAHLSLGTQRENIADMVRKGRQPRGDQHWSRKRGGLRGERHGASKLTDQAVPAVRQLYSEGMSQRAIGERFGVSQATIWQVLSGRTWDHVSSTGGGGRNALCTGESASNRS